MRLVVRRGALTIPLPSPKMIIKIKERLTGSFTTLEQTALAVGCSTVADERHFPVWQSSCLADDIARL